MKHLLIPFYYFWKLYIGFVFIITLVVFYPVLWLILQNEKLKPLSFKINIMWSRCIRILCFYAVELDYPADMRTESAVIIGNHTSYLDIFLLYSILPNNKFLFMGKSELLKYPLVRTFFKKLNIPVDRSSPIKSAKAFITAKKEMKNGWSVVIFPEGGIFNPTSKMTPFKDGAFQLAQLTKSPVLPLTFINNYRLFSDPTYLSAPAMPGLVKLKIHPIIEREEVINNDVSWLKDKSYRLIDSVL